ncbi:MAG: hypothetical protein LBV61_02390 [Burkholderiaceae bacterium]|nr:hypothetical protein [Burkholderiaceae bacterium]
MAVSRPAVCAPLAGQEILEMAASLTGVTLARRALRAVLPPRKRNTRLSIERLGELAVEIV